MSGELFDAAFGLAVADVWRAWDEATPDLTEVEVAPEALLDCADPDVRMLARLWVAIDAAVEAMHVADTPTHEQPPCKPRLGAPALAPAPGAHPDSTR